MRNLLATIGFRSGVYRRYKDKDAWELCIGRQKDVIRFYTKIGFSITRKQRRLGEILALAGLVSDNGNQIARGGFERAVGS